MNSKEWINSLNFRITYIKNKIIDLEDEYQHYTMVEKDRVREILLNEEIDIYKQILQDLERLEQLESENKELNRQLDVFFDKLDNNTLRAVDIISYELREENTKFEKVIDILRTKKVDIHLLLFHKLEDYNFLVRNENQLNQEEYELLKEVFERVGGSDE